MTYRLRTIWSRACAMFRKERLDREFSEELAAHLGMLIDEGRRKGLSEDGARRQAHLRLGWAESLRDMHRDQRGMPVLSVIAQDLRYAFRTLWKNRVFTCVATLSLALGVGANTALFSLVDNLLLRSLPVRNPDRLVQVELRLTLFGITKKGSSFPKTAFDRVRTYGGVFSEVVGFNQLDRPGVAIEGVIEPNRQVEQVSENFFRDLGIMPVSGRVPEPADGPAAMISHGFWRARFNGNSDVLGRALSVDGQAYSIVGVAPRRFHGLALDSSADLWIVPHAASPQQMIARLKPGIPAAQALAATELLFHRMAQEVPGIVPKLWPGAGMHVALVPAGNGLSQLRAQYERPLLALTVLVVLVLLLTCTNVGNLIVVRNTARRRELAVRIALGARRSRLVLQCLVESIVLATLGSILSLVFARWGVSIMLSMLPLPRIPEGLTFHSDVRVLSFAVAISLLSALLFGLAPAWRAAQVDLSAGLRSNLGTTQARSTRRLGRLLVASQVALSVLLLVGAGLFVQTLRNLVSIDVGFHPETLYRYPSTRAQLRDNADSPVARTPVRRRRLRAGTAARNRQRVIREPVLLWRRSDRQTYGGTASPGSEVRIMS